ncbi:hypothetical protein ACFQ0B_25225 [Nonomuraea thailandensis]
MDRRPWLATAMAAVVLLGLLVARLVFLYTADTTPGGLGAAGRAIAVASIVTLAALHALVMLRPGSRTRWLLVAEAVLVFAPYPACGAAWGPIAGVLGSAVLLTLAAPASWLVFALVLLADTAARIVFGPDEPWMVPIGWLFVDLNVGLTLFAMARLADRVRRESAQRRRLVALAVTRDRLSTASLLRSGIGTDLSAVIRLARRAGRAELTEITERARRSLAAAREIAMAQRELGEARRGGDEAPPAGPPVPVMFRFCWWTLLFVVLNHHELVISNLAELQPPGDARGWALVGAAVAALTALQLYHGLPRRDGSMPRAWRWAMAAQVAILLVMLLRLGMLASSAVLPCSARSRHGRGPRGPGCSPGSGWPGCWPCPSPMDSPTGRTSPPRASSPCSRCTRCTGCRRWPGG